MTHITLSEDERSHLRAVAEQTGKTEEQLVHAALAAFLETHVADTRLERMRRARGMWKGRADLPDVQQLRREFERY